MSADDPVTKKDVGKFAAIVAVFLLVVSALVSCMSSFCFDHC